MKKIFLSLFLVLCVISSRAQVFVGGSAGVAYSGVFSAALQPFAGYEFSQRLAVGGGVSYNLIDSESYVFVEPFVRYNCWNNSRFFFDIKGVTTFDLTGDDVLCQMGVVPSLRYRINPHWDTSVDVGMLGYNFSSEAVVISSKTTNVCLSLIYRF